MRVFVQGSQVCREVLDAVAHDGFTPVHTSSGHSLVETLGHAPFLDAALGTDRIARPAVRRAVERSLEGDPPDALERHADQTDLLLWDLWDERLGVWDVAGTYATRTAELVASGLDQVMSRRAPLVRFGSAQHVGLWRRALDRWVERLRRLDLLDRTVLVPPTHVTSHWSQETDLTGFEHLAGRYLDVVRRSFPAARILGGATTGRPDDLVRRLADGLRALVLDPDQAFPPSPVVTIDGGLHATVTTSATWAERFALYAVRDGQVVRRFGYQERPQFDVSLPEPGRYRFRVFHVAGETKAVLSSPTYVFDGEEWS